MSTRRSTRSGSRRADPELGAGVIATTTGVLTFLLFLLVGVQVLFNLYATSAVQAAAFDAARIAAGSGSDKAGPAAQARTRALAEEHVRSVLGRYGDDRVKVANLAFGAEDVALTVRAENPSFLPRLLNPSFAFGVVEKTVRVRIEDEQP